MCLQKSSIKIISE